ncbi:hypothetical protein SAMN04244579_03955 [Azotobacter beijerinckii]|uniref:Uncharacterized protein n=1 Tax=Azotobacter beijerinckii TaxID=170623 RepID=A0A1H6Y2A1_9GAMM|nr:hypothetical protein [Azotobacter beijerinckii]SEJ33157.1 hypothetical protein SAMN04244579_03955 [Azotobacter beijerinckii]
MASTKSEIVGIIDSELVKDAVLTDMEMSYQNFARSEFDKLECLVRQFIVPALGSDQNPVAKDIYRHLEQIRIFSGNFCWRYRYIGASHDAKEVRHA